jgi:hypothetical protein
MKLPRTTRGTSAPPTLALKAASVRLGYATATPNLRPSRRNPRSPEPPSRARLGSPFTFHPISRGASPSIAEEVTAYKPQSAYWLRSSREPEWAYLANQLSTPSDLERLITHARRSADHLLLTRCQEILVEAVLLYITGPETRESLLGMELGRLIQYADRFGFWGLDRLPGRIRREDESVDRFATPPAQILHSHYR